MLTFFTRYIRNILQLHFIHLRVQLYFFRGIVHGASGLTYKISKNLKNTHLNQIHNNNGYDNQPVQRPIRGQRYTGNRKIAQTTEEC